MTTPKITERIANSKELVRKSDLTFTERIELYDLLDMLKASLRDGARWDWLEKQGVEMIYLKGHRQINPGSSNVRASIDYAAGRLDAAMGEPTNEGGKS